MFYFLIITGSIIILTAIGMVPNIISVIKHNPHSDTSIKRIEELEKCIKELQQQRDDDENRIKQIETTNEFWSRLLENRNDKK